ncbi:hypothetical protein KCV06_g10, partial [Aureobasidium melanogenum]
MPLQQLLYTFTDLMFDHTVHGPLLSPYPYLLMLISLLNIRPSLPGQCTRLNCSHTGSHQSQWLSFLFHDRNAVTEVKSLVRQISVLLIVMNIVCFVIGQMNAVCNARMKDVCSDSSSRSTAGVRGPLLSRADMSSVVDLVWNEFRSAGVGVLLRLPLNVPERGLIVGVGTSAIASRLLTSPPICSSSTLGIGESIGMVTDLLLGVRDPGFVGVAIAVSSSGTFLFISIGVLDRSFLASEKSREVQLGR